MLFGFGSDLFIEVISAVGVWHMIDGSGTSEMRHWMNQCSGSNPLYTLLPFMTMPVWLIMRAAICWAAVCMD